MSCELQLNFFDEALSKRENWAIRFFDLWAKLQSGALHRNVRNFGLFTECLRFRHDSTNSEVGVITGQYCTVSHRASVTSEWDREANFTWRDIGQIARENNLLLQSGICVPSLCSNQEAIDYANRFLQQADLRATNAVCQANEKSSLTVVDIIAIFVVTLLFLVLLSSTMYDVIMRKKPVGPKKIFIAFSLYSNTRDLLKIEEKTSRSIDCIQGLRALSALWIVAGHRMIRHNRMVSRPMKNETFVSQVIIGLFLSNPYAVDTFFLISGVLIAQSCLRSLDKKKLNLVKLYFARYFRYVPSLALLLLLFTSSLPYILADGPVISFLDNEVSHCLRYWWSSLLLIQNYVNVNTVCLPHTWYLSADFQLFLLSPIFIYLLWKFKNRALWSFGFAVFISQLSIFLVRFYETISIHLVYRQTHFRIGQFLIGIALGYIMYARDGKNHMRKRSQMIGWIVALGSFLAAEIFYSSVSFSFSEALFASTHRIAWACLTGWIIYVCHHLKSGGIINWFLSQPLWQPIAKISLSIYLIHDPYIILTVANMKDLWYFEPAWLMHIVLGDIGASTILGGILYLIIEAPSNLVVQHFLK